MTCTDLRGHRRADSSKIVNYFPLALVFLALVLATTMVVLHPPIDLNTSQWGLVTQLPVTYWAGLLVIGSLTYRGRDSRFYLAASLALAILYLFGLPTFLTGYNLDHLPVSLYNFREGVLVAKEAYLRAEPTEPLIRYHYWPGFLFVSALLYQITGIDSVAIPNYLSLFTLSLDAVLVFCILHLKLSPARALLGCLVFVAAFWTTQQQFHPQGMAYIFYLLYFWLIAKEVYHPGQTRLVYGALIPVLFAVSVLTQPLTPVMMSIATAAILLSRRFLTARNPQFINLTLIAFLGIFFLGYWIYVAAPAFALGVQKLQLAISGEETTSFRFVLRRLGEGSMYSVLTVAISYLAVVLVSSVALLGFISTFREKASKAEDAFWAAWLVSLPPVGAFLYAHEGLFRAYMFGLAPISYFFVRYIGNRQWVFTALFTVIALLHVPAHYGFPGYMRTITTIEDAGTAFYVRNTTASSFRFYGANWLPALWYHDPSVAGYEWFTLLTPPFAPEIMVAPNSPVPTLSKSKKVFYREFPYLALGDIKVLYGEITYIGHSSLVSTYYSYYLGFDPLKQLHLGDWSNLIYANGEFKLYHNLAVSLGSSGANVAQ